MPLLPTGVALEQIGRGLTDGADRLDVVSLPFGSGPTFDEAVAACRSQASFVRVPAEASSTREAGEHVAAARASPGSSSRVDTARPPTVGSGSSRGCSASPSPM